MSALLRAWAAGAAVALAASAAPAQDANKNEKPSAWVVRAKKVHVRPGEVIENGAIAIQDGKIAAVGTSVDAPSGAVTVEAEEVTAGLVEASGSAGERMEGIEDSSEITPSFRAAANLDTENPNFGRLARGGVTTVFVAPETLNVVGGIASVVKSRPLAAPRAVAADAALRIAFGDDPARGNFTPRGFGLPNSFHVRRPGSRPGTVMEMRMAFSRAERALAGLGALPDGWGPIAGALQGKIPVRAHAYYLVDLRSALRVAKEFGLANLTIDGAMEAHRCLPELREARAKLVIGPHARNPSGGVDGRGRSIDYGDVRPAQDLLARVAAAGIPVALSAHGAEPEDDLAAQMRIAVRYGASREAALRAVTSGAAEVLGLQDSVGTVEAGRDADLVLWSGDPFETATRVVQVFVDGRPVHAKSR